MKAGLGFYIGSCVGTAVTLMTAIIKVDLSDPKDCSWWFRRGSLWTGAAYWERSIDRVLLDQSGSCFLGVDVLCSVDCVIAQGPGDAGAIQAASGSDGLCGCE